MIDGPTSLIGQVLIAMPGMGDPRFEHSVVFMCAHSEDGAMGLIVNKPVGGEASLAQLLTDLDLPSPPARDLPLYFGGPVDPGRGFVLHSSDFASDEGTQEVSDDVSMTATVDILEEIARGEGPDRAILALGYAGWGPGQIESEIVSNGWLTGIVSTQLLFECHDDDKWRAAMADLGIDPLTLSMASGRA